MVTKLPINQRRRTWKLGRGTNLDQVYLGTIYCLSASLVWRGLSGRAVGAMPRGGRAAGFWKCLGLEKNMKLGRTSKLYSCDSKFLILATIRPLKSLNLR